MDSSGQPIAAAYREGFGGGSNTPEIPKFWQNRTGLQIERKMFSVPIPTSQLDLKLLNLGKKAVKF